MAAKKTKQSAAKSTAQPSSQPAPTLRRSTRNRTPSVEPETPSLPASTPSRSTRKTSAEKSLHEDSANDEAKPKPKRGRKKKPVAPKPEPIPEEEHEAEADAESESQGRDLDLESQAFSEPHQDNEEHIHAEEHVVEDEPLPEPQIQLEIEQEEVVLEDEPVPQPDTEEMELGEDEPVPQPDTEEDELREEPELELEPEPEPVVINDDGGDLSDEPEEEADSRKRSQGLSVSPPPAPESTNPYPSTHAVLEESEISQAQIKHASLAALQDWHAVAKDDSVVPPGTSLEDYLYSLCHRLEANHIADLLVEQFKEIKKLKSDGHGMLDRAKKAADDLEVSRTVNRQLVKTSVEERERAKTYKEHYEEGQRLLHESRLDVTREKRKRVETENEYDSLNGKHRKLNDRHQSLKRAAREPVNLRLAAAIVRDDLVIVGAKSADEAARMRELLLYGLPKDGTAQQWKLYNQLLSSIPAWDHPKITDIRAKTHGRKPYSTSNTRDSGSGNNMRKRRDRVSDLDEEDDILEDGSEEHMAGDSPDDRRVSSGGRPGFPVTPTHASNPQDSSWTGSFRNVLGSVSKFLPFGRRGTPAVAPKTEPVPRTRKFRMPAREAAEASAASASINSHTFIPRGFNKFERLDAPATMASPVETTTIEPSGESLSSAPGNSRVNTTTSDLAPPPGQSHSSFSPNTTKNLFTSHDENEPQSLSSLTFSGSPTQRSGIASARNSRVEKPELSKYALARHQYELQLGIQTAYGLSSEERWTNKIGLKRKRMVTVRMKDLKKPDNLDPISPGGFGLDADFFSGDSDDSDEEVEVSEEFAEKFLRPSNKKQKTSTGSSIPSAPTPRSTRSSDNLLTGAASTARRASIDPVSPPAASMTYFVPDFSDSSDEESESSAATDRPLISEEERKIMEALPKHVGHWPDDPKDEEVDRAFKKTLREDNFRADRGFTRSAWEDLKRRWEEFNESPVNGSSTSPLASGAKALSEGKVQDNIFSKSAGTPEPQQQEPRTPAKEGMKQPQTPGDDIALARARSQAEKYKPKTPSGLREASRIASSPAQSLGSPALGSPALGSPTRDPLLPGGAPPTQASSAPLPKSTSESGLVNDGTLDFARRLANLVPIEMLPTTELPLSKPGTIQIHDSQVLEAVEAFSQSEEAKVLDEYYHGILSAALNKNKQ